MKPPECRSCGAVEWRHVCAGASNKATRGAAAAGVQASSIKHRMSALGKVGGPRGGKARAAKLSAERRSEIARAAAAARWGKA